MHGLSALKRPSITGKSTLRQERNKYVVEVLPRANTPQIREAVERAFEVSVIKVNIVTTPGERRRLRTGRWLVRKPTKKAVVTLKPGDAIQLFGGA